LVCEIPSGEITNWIKDHLTMKPKNALYFLSMSTNPTYVLAAIEPSSGLGQHYLYINQLPAIFNNF
jgi:hypothetical protein